MKRGISIIFFDQLYSGFPDDKVEFLVFNYLKFIFKFIKLFYLELSYVEISLLTRISKYIPKFPRTQNDVKQEFEKGRTFPSIDVSLFSRENGWHLDNEVKSNVS